MGRFGHAAPGRRQGLAGGAGVSEDHILARGTHTHGRGEQQFRGRFRLGERGRLPGRGQAMAAMHNCG
jgi:hypothetical protein